MKKVTLRTKILVKGEFTGAEKVTTYLSRTHRAHIIDWYPSPIKNSFILDSHRPIKLIKNLIRKANKKFPDSKEHLHCFSINKNDASKKFTEVSTTAQKSNYQKKAEQFLSNTGDW